MNGTAYPAKVKILYNKYRKEIRRERQTKLLIRRVSDLKYAVYLTEYTFYVNAYFHDFCLLFGVPYMFWK